MLYILNKEYELEGRELSLDKIQDIIEDELKDTGYTFSHVEVDGKKIYNIEEEYDLSRAKEMKIVTKTIKEFINSIIESNYEYIIRSMPEIESVSDSFYGEVNMEDWADIDAIIDGFSWIIETYRLIDNVDNLGDIVSNYEVWNEYAREVHKLKDIIKDVDKAMRDEDTVLIADIISDNILPVYKEMEKKLKELI